MISAVVIAFSFAMVVGVRQTLFSKFFMMLIAVGVGFIGHELAHKYMAQRYGCLAEYRMWDTGLIMAFFGAIFLGVVFAAPGAVYIQCQYYGITERQNGIISAAGAIVNLGLALIFIVIGSIFGGYIGMVAAFGTYVNAYLALFNMLPFPPLDGSKVMGWNPGVWIGIIAAAFMIMRF